MDCAISSGRETLERRSRGQGALCGLLITTMLRDGSLPEVSRGPHWRADSGRMNRVDTNAVAGALRATDRAQQTQGGFARRIGAGTREALMPEADDTRTTLPPRPRLRMARTACLVPRKAPSRLIAMTWRHVSSVTLADRAACATPALTTRMSKLRSCSTTRATALSQPGSLVMSRRSVVMDIQHQPRRQVPGRRTHRYP